MIITINKKLSISSNNYIKCIKFIVFLIYEMLKYCDVNQNVITCMLITL